MIEEIICCYSICWVKSYVIIDIIGILAYLLYALIGGLRNWILFGVNYFCDAVIYETRNKLMLKRLVLPCFSNWSGGKVVVLMTITISRLAFSFQSLSMSINHLLVVENNYVWFNAVMQGRVNSLSFSPLYIIRGGPNSIVL